MYCTMRMFSVCYLLIIVGLVWAGSVVQRPGVDDDCAKFCDATYMGKGDQLSSCKDGCRLFSVVQITGGRNDAANIKSECRKTCIETYSNNAELGESCSNACEHQTLKVGTVKIDFDEKSRMKGKLLQIMDSLTPDININGIFNQMDQMLNGFWDGAASGSIRNMLNRMKSSMTSWNGFFGEEKPGDDRTSAVLPQVAVPQADSDAPAVLTDDVKHLDSDSAVDLPVVGNSDENGEPIIVVHVVPAGGLLVPPKFSAEDSTVAKDDVPPHEPSPPVGIYVDDDWLACVGRRVRHLSNAMRLMLFMALMLSVISMIWICLAILRTAPRRRLIGLNAGGKGGVENVYYATPPFTASDKAPMIIKTSDYKAQPVSETPPPPYEVTGEEKKSKTEP